MGVGVAGDRRDETGDIGGAAGTAEPGIAGVLTDRQKRIRVEEAVAVHRDSG